MGLSKKLGTSITLMIIAISVIVWILLLYNPGNIMTIEHCHVSASGPSAKSLRMLLDMNPFSSQLLGWGLMVIAMMLPKLIIPIQFIYARSLKRLRFLCALLFVLGYLCIWMFAGVFMILVIVGFNLWMPMSFIPACIVGVVAIIWQFSPVKQKCLNLGHDHWNLPAFGWPAIRSSFLFGIMHGVWCIGSGWAIMLFPMLLPQGHNLAMIAVTLIMISEHLDHPSYPKWNFNLRLKLFKIVIAQMKLRLTSPQKINF
jgi:predicted metal-binding membrane protein